MNRARACRRRNEISSPGEGTRLSWACWLPGAPGRGDQSPENTGPAIAGRMHDCSQLAKDGSAGTGTAILPSV